MRDAKSNGTPANPTNPDADAITNGHHRLQSADPASRYSSEQRETLEQGLRILARLVVRAYLQRHATLPTTNPQADGLDTQSLPDG